jgi:hypothetical protein
MESEQNGSNTLPRLLKLLMTYGEVLDRCTCKCSQLDLSSSLLQQPTAWWQTSQNPPIRPHLTLRIYFLFIYLLSDLLHQWINNHSNVRSTDVQHGVMITRERYLLTVHWIFVHSSVFPGTNALLHSDRLTIHNSKLYRFVNILWAFWMLWRLKVEDTLNCYWKHWA